MTLGLSDLKDTGIACCYRAIQRPDAKNNNLVFAAIEVEIRYNSEQIISSFAVL
jgi:hypothetical protein